MSRSATLTRGKRKTATRARAKRPSLASRMLSMVPIPPEQLHRWTGRAVAVGLVAIALGAATLLGVPQMAGVAAAEVIGRAGFAVKRVEIAGIDRMERLTVYAIATDQQSLAMPLVDLTGVREQLLRYGWIADARVSRRLPDTLVIDIVERKPAAVWQHNRNLALVDAAGVVLEPVQLDALPDLPLVIGPQANRQIGRLNGLLRAAPTIRPMLASATWVGDRRWDLQFQTGETLALPEGDTAAVKALTRFASLDAKDGLLGRGFLRFDLRNPKQLVVRVPRGGVVPDAALSDAPAPPQPRTAGPATGNTAEPLPPMVEQASEPARLIRTGG